MKTLLPLWLSLLAGATTLSTTAQNPTGPSDVLIGQSGAAQNIISQDPSYTIPGTNWISRIDYISSDGANLRQSYTFYDGLGYPIQQVAINGATNKHLVTPIVYDQSRRANAKQYLPYAYKSPTESSRPKSIFDLAGLANQQNFYKSLNDEDYLHAYAETTFDGSPLNRVMKVTRPGEIYRTKNKSTEYAYGLNDASDSVLQISRKQQYKQLWRSRYAAKQLHKTSITDEDGAKHITFTDFRGLTVLERIITADLQADTYYVYDELDRLRWVISPEGAKQLIGVTIDYESPIARNYCYIYQYDQRGDLVEQRMPGKEPDYFIYDTYHHLIMSQNAMQRSKNQWIRTEYGYRDQITIQYVDIPVDSTQSNQPIFGTRKQARPLLMPRYYGFKYLPEQQFGEDDVIKTLQALKPRYFVIPPALAFANVEGVVDSPQICPMPMGLKMYEKVYTPDDMTKYTERAFYYNTKSQLVQIVEQSSPGHLLRTSMSYDLQGKVRTSVESVTLSPGAAADLKTTEYTYDNWGRITQARTSLNGHTSRTGYRYNSIGQCSSIYYDSIPFMDPTKPLPRKVAIITSPDITFEYNLQGWLTQKKSDKFTMDLRYYDPQLGTQPSFTGNISEWQWTHDPKLDSTRYTYAYSYDPLGRMTGATLFENKSRTDRFTEKGITYDLNGNIRSLNRYADQKLADSLKFDYIGNKINTLTKNARTTGSLNTGSKETIKLDAVDKSGLINSLKPNLDISSILHPKYSYDPSGNMTFDQRTGYTISYDCLGFIKKVERANTTLANYTYLADGTLVAVEDQNKNGYVYIGSLVYAKRGDDLTLESTACDMGRIRKTEAGYQTEYFLTDHLGSPRAIINARKELIAQNDFYPYGGRWEAPEIPTNDGRYLFNGKEKQVTGGIGWLNFGARMYDPVTGRWTQPDPMEQLYRHIGAYVYCAGDPVRFIDPNGMKLVDARGNILHDGKNWTAQGNKSKNLNLRSVLTELQNTPTGKERFEYLVNSETPTVIKFGTLKAGAYGENTNQLEASGIQQAEITLDMVNMKEKAKANGITLMQAVAATTGHEIRHTELINVDMQLKSRMISPMPKDEDLEEEKDARIIDNKIINEYKNKIKPQNEKANSRSWWDSISDYWSKMFD